MTRPCHVVRLMTAALCAALFAAAPSPAPAQNLQSGDIIIPGVVAGGTGCFYRLRGGVATQLFESQAYGYPIPPADMVVDSQGRLVFFASPLPVRNYNDIALYRIDPASGVLERLFYFPNIVAPGDTLPGGASSATGFSISGYPRQSLHLQKRMEVVIDDDQNGGWPQIQSAELYGFAMQTAVSSGQAPTNYSYGAGDGSCGEGISSSLLPWAGVVPYMANNGSRIYYGSGKVIGRTGLAARVEMHLNGDWGQFDASLLPLPPRNELIITGTVFDNTRYPNGYAECGAATDSDVPYHGGGSGFSVLDMNGLGVLGGKPYIISNSGATPYVFDIATRAPYLNVNACFWDTATEGRGMLDFSLPDGTPTSSGFTSPDGGALLGLSGYLGVIQRIGADGSFEQLDSSQPYTGRPWRWHGPSSSAVAAAAADSGQVLVVRVDALAYVLLTDALGRRIGHDAAGNPVNDFGETGQVLSPGAGGWPRLIVLRDPPNEVLSAEVAATGAGDWTVKAYLAHEDGGSLLATTTGTASGAGSVARGLYVGQPTVLTWFADPIVGVGEPTATEGMGFVSVGPIPARGEVRLAYRVPGNGARVRIDIFDVAGRLMTTPVNGPVAGGMHTLAWSGNGPSGARLAHGIYLASLDVNGRRETRRIVLTD